MNNTPYIADPNTAPMTDYEILIFRQQAEDERAIAEYNVRSARRVLTESERRLREVQTYIDWLAGIRKDTK